MRNSLAVKCGNTGPTGEAVQWRAPVPWNPMAVFVGDAARHCTNHCCRWCGGATGCWAMQLRGSETTCACGICCPASPLCRWAPVRLLKRQRS